jgi:hypothetical protein
VDVHLPDGTSYRDHTVVLFDDDPFIGGNSTPYNTLVEGPATLNYRQQSLATGGVQGDTGAAFAGDPATAVFRARVGDPVRVHVVSAPGSEQPKVASLGGLTWPQDPSIEGSNPVSAQALAPMNALDLHVQGGAGGRAGAVGDTFVGDLRRPFTVAGLWGLLRTLPAATDCQAPRPLAGLPGCPRPAAPVLDRVPQPEPPAQPDPGPAPAPPPAPPAAPVIAPETVVQGAPITPSPTAPPRRLTRAGLPSRLALTAARRRGIPVTVRPDADSRSVRLTLRRGAGGPVIVRRTFRLAVQAQRGRTPRPVTLVLRAPASRLVPGLHVVTIEVPGFAPRTGRVTLVGPVTPGRG